jgi:hypothetical protein
MKPQIRMRQVFVPGGQPEHTYVPREGLRLEAQLEAALDNLCKLVTITGPTKSGKSVLTKKVYPRDRAVWIDGGAISTEEDLWLAIIERLDAYTDVTTTRTSTASTDLGVEISTQASLPFFVKGQAKAAPKMARARQSSETRIRRGSAKLTALEQLRATHRPLIIDDFHYLRAEVQASVVRALKALVFDGHPILLLAIPHRRYDAIRVEKEMTGRVHQVPIPPWSPQELLKIPELGFSVLNIEVPKDPVGQFVNECLASPHLMQEFCRELCESNDISERLEKLRPIAPAHPIDQLFTKVATDTSKTMFERLAKGPRQRSDRTQRRFRDGSTGDIYVAVLLAIAKLKPGIATLEYEQIRAALRDLLEELPEAHEVSRVLEHMASIQADQGSSAPVLDWEKTERRLHIIDPFFAFFLRWGATEARVRSGVTNTTAQSTE